MAEHDRTKNHHSQVDGCSLNPNRFRADLKLEQLWQGHGKWEMWVDPRMYCIGNAVGNALNVNLCQLTLYIVDQAYVALTSAYLLDNWKAGSRSVYYRT